MPQIKFLPGNQSVAVAAGSELQVAFRKAGMDLEFPCGGKGSCGKCRVRIVSGNVEDSTSGVLSRTAKAEGFVVSCQTRVLSEAVTIEVSPIADQIDSTEKDGSPEINVSSYRLLAENENISPPVELIDIIVPQPQLEDGLSDTDRLQRCLQNRTRNIDLHMPLEVVRKLADNLREKDGHISLLGYRLAHTFSIIDLKAEGQNLPAFGIAVDVGTTTLAVALVDLSTTEIVATGTDYNDQIRCGLDVISRINYAQRPKRLSELQALVLQSINRLINNISDKTDIQTESIGCALLSGNTTMVHLLLGLKPEYIRLEPYTPTILKPEPLPAHELGITINSQAPLFFSPAVGSYVGGDITAGLLCTPMISESDGIMMFLDVGTNGELAIGNRDFLVTCACSAGPAFEGGGIEWGQRAAPGAIERVEVDAETGAANCRIIGSLPPTGICGSGLISLLDELFTEGWIDGAGKLDRERKTDRIRIEGRKASYVLVPGSKGKRDITISELEIENVIRAKAAIYSACALLVEQVGIEFVDLDQVYIAGGFGQSLDAETAIGIGLLPDLPLDRFEYIGNASLIGSYLTLVSERYRLAQQKLAETMTYIELSRRADYMDHYTAALFLPHTDSSQFPSLKNKKGTRSIED